MAPFGIAGVVVAGAVGNVGKPGGVVPPGVPPGGVVQPATTLAHSANSRINRTGALRIRRLTVSM
jgi:hypothetical protein